MMNDVYEIEKAEWAGDLKKSLNQILWNNLPGETTIEEADKLALKLWSIIMEWKSQRRPE